MYSQQGEDDLVLPYLPDSPTFSLLDIGAGDGKEFSNSRALLEARPHTRAVLVEPCPTAFGQLLRLYGNQPQIALINAALVARPPEPALVPFYWSQGHQFSTLSLEHKAWGENYLCRVIDRMFTMWVRPLTTQELLQQFPGPFDLVSIDVEGTNLEIIQSLPRTFFHGTKVLIIEHGNHPGEIEQEALRCGFRRIASNGINLIFVPDV